MKVSPPSPSPFGVGTFCVSSGAAAFAVFTVACSSLAPFGVAVIPVAATSAYVLLVDASGLVFFAPVSGADVALLVVPSSGFSASGVFLVFISPWLDSSLSVVFTRCYTLVARYSPILSVACLSVLLVVVVIIASPPTVSSIFPVQRLLTFAS